MLEVDIETKKLDQRNSKCFECVTHHRGAVAVTSVIQPHKKSTAISCAILCTKHLAVEVLRLQ